MSGSLVSMASSTAPVLITTTSTRYARPLTVITSPCWGRAVALPVPCHLVLAGVDVAAAAQAHNQRLRDALG
jgi:hypothetical protein